MATGITDIKSGFYLGLGVALALAVWAAIQALLGKVTRSG